MRERVLELVGPAGVVEEVRRRERQVDVPGLADRLAAVQGLQYRKLARALLEDPRDPEQILRALGGARRRPAVLERVARTFDGERHVLGTRLRDLRERLLARRIERLVVLAGARLDELAAAEDAVPLLELDDLARFRRGRVLPGRRDRRAVAALFEFGQCAFQEVRPASGSP